MANCYCCSNKSPRYLVIVPNSIQAHSRINAACKRSVIKDNHENRRKPLDLEARKQNQYRASQKRLQNYSLYKVDFKSKINPDN